jgi:thiol:disulfide interchange protein DsbD
MRTFLMLLFPLLMPTAWAGSPVKWSFTADPASGDTVAVRLTAVCDPGWHIYALTLPSDEGPLPTVITVRQDSLYRIAGPATGPAPQEKDDPNFGMRVRYHGGTTSFVQPVVRLTQGAFTIRGQVEYMACNEMTCLPPVPVPFHLDIPALK